MLVMEGVKVVVTWREAGVVECSMHCSGILLSFAVLWCAVMFLTIMTNTF